MEKLAAALVEWRSARALGRAAGLVTDTRLAYEDAAEFASLREHIALKIIEGIVGKQGNAAINEASKLEDSVVKQLVSK